MAVFVTVADAKNFRVAGERLGVSASAVSQTLRKLERCAVVHCSRISSERTRT